jgi:uncharacterized protein with HEPN domain
MKDDLTYLRDILDSAYHIRDYARNVTRLQFNQDEMRQDAIVRRIEIMGEATKQLSMNFRQQYPNLPWKQMAGMRDVVIHNYAEVDLDFVWQVMIEEIAPLIKQLEALLPPEDANPD